MMMMMIIIIIIMIINYIPIIRLALSSYTQVYEKSDPPDTGGGGQRPAEGEGASEDTVAAEGHWKKSGYGGKITHSYKVMRI